MRLSFCRVTQLGFLRLLTMEAVMGDACLAAFAEASQVTLVTFDRAFRGKLKSLILLEE